MELILEHNVKEWVKFNMQPTLWNRHGYHNWQYIYFAKHSKPFGKTEICFFFFFFQEGDLESPLKLVYHFLRTT